MKNRTFRSVLSVILLLAVLTVCAFSAVSCGMGSSPDSEPYDEYGGIEPAEKVSDITWNGGKTYEEGDPQKLPEEKAAAIEQKLIRTVDIYAETKEYDAAVSAIEQAVTANGGYIESQNARGISYGGGNSRRVMNLKARIPSENLNQFTDGVSAEVNVTHFSKNTDNVTEAYYDAAARLETLKTERESLLEMMKSINTTDNYNFWYTLHERISEIEQSIASLEATIRNYDSKVTYSTVSIELQEVVELTPVDSVPTFGERMKKAFTESWKDFAEGWKDFAVGLVGAVPTLLTIALILGLIGLIPFFIVRGVKKKHRRNAQKTNE